MRASDPSLVRSGSAAARCAIGAVIPGFEQSLHEFTEVAREVADLGDLTGGGDIGHGDLEKLLSRRSHAIARQMMQDTLDKISAQEEVRGDVVGPGGFVLRYPRRRVRMLETVFGPVWISRLGYRDRGTGSVFPLDAQLNLPSTRYSHGLQELAAWVVAQASYDAAAEHIGKLTGGRFPRRQIEAMVQDYVTDFDSFYADHPIAVQADHEPNSDLLIASVDGKGIVMRHDDLREETKRRAEGASHKYQKRLSRGEKRNRKRMAEVAVVYDVAVYHRTAEDVILTEHRSKDAPRPRNKRVWASVEKELAEVLDDVMEEVKRRDPQRQRTLVILLDGQEGQIRQVNDAAKRHGRKGAVVIQDLFHVSEYAWRAARCFYDETDPAAEEWVSTRLVEILKGNSSNVAAGMTRSATLRGLSKSARAEVDRTARYLVKNRMRLRYDLALKIGAPVGTGVVEGACRHLVRARMECSGARWSLDGAEAVLKLRALRMSGDWESYCAYHWRQEHSRHYPEYTQRQAA
jgi:hypothetical protein